MKHTKVAMKNPENRVKGCNFIMTQITICSRMPSKSSNITFVKFKSNCAFIVPLGVVKPTNC